jgi:two-component system sensor histidine kinase VicK
MRLKMQGDAETFYSMENSNLDLFRQIGDSSNDTYFVYNVAEARFTYLSLVFESMWNINRSSVIEDAVYFLQTVHPEDRSHVVNCYYDFKEHAGEKKYQFRILADNNADKYIRVSLYPVTGQGETNLIAGIAEDITIVKRNIFYTEKINARKNSTLEILAHDLKGPLGMISMMASSIQKEAQLEGKDHILQAVKFIQDMCSRNIALIRNLVNQEFLESTEVELRKERADLVWEIQDVIDNYKRSEENIAKVFIINSTDEKLYVHIDSLKLMQVINNLISNAIKFTPDNGVIEVNIRNQQNTVLIMVSDNGIGIPKDMHPYLFDKFTKARRPGLKGEEPVGLGMSIIKTLIELHGGKITFESEEGMGSKFFIEIPK